VPPNRALRNGLYAAFTALLVTGAAWLAATWSQQGLGAGAWAETATLMLMLHGGAAMATLMLLGAFFSSHLLPGWRRRRNRLSGVTVLTATALLVLTAFGLYYVGSDWLRSRISDLHIAVGLGFPALLTLHVVWGKRGARRNGA
jgi:hypothetical protein